MCEIKQMGIVYVALVRFRSFRSESFKACKIKSEVSL